MPNGSAVMIWVLTGSNTILLAIVIGMLRPFVASYLKLRDDFYGKDGVQERLAIVEDRVVNAQRESIHVWPRGATHNTAGG